MDILHLKYKIKKNKHMNKEIKFWWGLIFYYYIFNFKIFVVLIIFLNFIFYFF